MAPFRLRAAAAGLAAALLTGVPVHAETETVKAPTRPESGFEVVVVGIMPGIKPDDFSRAVADALPPALVDPTVNFTRDAAYKSGGNYRLVMAFHGEDVMEAANLCRTPSAVDARPPAPNDLMTATRVTGAFCSNEQPLSTATDRMVGSVSPGQAGFRFLVADVTKQLFPNGFSSIPGTISSAPPSSGSTSGPVETAR